MSNIEFDYVELDDELYHHGILGMKWGVRRYQNEDGSLTDEGRRHYGIKEAKANMKAAAKNLNRSTWGVGMLKYDQNKKKYQEARNEYVDRKAEDKYNKAIDRGATQRNAEKAEMKEYQKGFRGNGLPGSAKDEQTGGHSTSLYNHLVEKKGEDYANTVLKKEETRLMVSLGAAATVTAAAYVAEIMMILND